MGSWVHQPSTYYLSPVHLSRPGCRVLCITARCSVRSWREPLKPTWRVTPVNDTYGPVKCSYEKCNLPIYPSHKLLDNHLDTSTLSATTTRPTDKASITSTSNPEFPLSHWLPPGIKCSNVVCILQTTLSTTFVGGLSCSYSPNAPESGRIQGGRSATVMRSWIHAWGITYLQTAFSFPRNVCHIHVRIYITLDPPWILHHHARSIFVS